MKALGYIMNLSLCTYQLPF